MVLAPGHTLVEHHDKISSFIKKERPVVIAINSIPDGYDVDYIFVSNRKRLLALNYDANAAKIIITSNLPKLTDDFICVDYDSLCDKSFEQPDNAGMMLLRLLSELGLKKATLAGFDGFTSPEQENYFSQKIANHNTPEIARKKNADISKQIQKVAKQINIEFLTPSLYQENENGKQKI